MDINGYKINNETGIIEGCMPEQYKLTEPQQYREIVVQLIKENLNFCNRVQKMLIELKGGR